MSDPWSMPWAAPVFDPPPHSWQGVRSVVMSFQPDPEGLAAVLPPPLEPGEGPGMLTMLSYPWGSPQRTHPFNETVVLVPVRLGDEVANYVPFIYVTTDEAMIAGREMAGWPKKIADIAFERDGDSFRGSVTRFGEKLIEVEGDFSALPEDDGSMAAIMANGQRPTYNYKLIPGPGLEMEVEEITSSSLDIVPSEVAVGAGTLRAWSSEDDPVARVVAGASGAIVGMVSDNTIPLAEVVHRIERRAGAPAAS